MLVLNKRCLYRCSYFILRLIYSYSNLGLHAAVEEGQVLLLLLSSHHLSHSSTSLVVVQQLDEGVVGRPFQHLFVHPGEERVLCLVSTMVRLGACTHSDWSWSTHTKCCYCGTVILALALACPAHEKHQTMSPLFICTYMQRLMVARFMNPVILSCHFVSTTDFTKIL